MKYIYKILAFSLIACCIGLTSCSDDDSDFDGTDAYFTSFALHVGETTYTASIINNEIVVQVPQGTDLVEAEASYTLSENAKVMPDPKDIYDWTSDQLFRVEAYNKSYNSFVYKLKYTDISTDEDVILRTQADVDSFESLKANRINGNLIIGSTTAVAKEDSIRNLNGLSTLNEVAYNIIINPSFGGTHLAGLSNLHQAGGLYIGTLENEAKFNQEKINITLPQLKSVGNLIIRSNNINEIYLPELEEASSIHIQSQMLEQLDMSDLVNCYGTLTLNGSQVTSDGSYGNPLNETSANSTLLTIDLPALAHVEGDFNLVYFWKTNTLKLPTLKTIGGNCIANTLKNIQKVSFPALEKVTGKFNSVGNDGMSKIDLSALTHAGNVSIASLNEFSINLKEINLQALQSVDNDLTIRFAIVEELQFPNLTKVGNKLTCEKMQFIEKVNAPLLKECKKVNFEVVNLLKEFNLPLLTQVEEFVISSSRLIESIDLSTIQKAEKVSIKNCPALTLISAPKQITTEFSVGDSGGDKLEINTLQKTPKFNVSGGNAKELIIKDLTEAEKFSLSSGKAKSVIVKDLTNAGDFSLESFKEATHLEVPLLEKVKSFTMSEWFKLENFNFPKLSTVEKKFSFKGVRSQWDKNNECITTNLNAFSALTQAESIEVQFAAHLTDFTGLKNVVQNVEAKNWKVENNKYNPTHQDMLDGKYTENK